MISIDVCDSKILITGDTGLLTGSIRVKLILKRFSAEITSGQVIIHCINQTDTVSKIRKIQTELLDKFGINYEFSESSKNVLSSYLQECESFILFSENARKIRNDEFSDNKDLIQEFSGFQEIISKDMIRKLTPLQLLSAFHMAFSRNACNFSVPGAGKTSIVYAAYNYLKSLPESDNSHVDKLMVIGPLSSFFAWENEHKECFGRTIESERLSGKDEYGRIITKDAKLLHLYSPNPKELTLISHGYVNRIEKEIKDFLAKNKTMLVVDEAHRIKNAEGLWGTSAVEIAKGATSRIALTGTPMPNGYQDLYNLFKFIYPFKYEDILKIHLAQLEDMTRNDEDSDSIRAKELFNNISPYFVRTKKIDLKLPGVEEATIKVDLDSDQQRIYNFIFEKSLPYFKNNASGTEMNLKDKLNRARLIRLRQASINPGLLLKPISESLEVGQYTEGDLLDCDSMIFGDDEMYNLVLNYSNKHVPLKFQNCLELINTQILPANEKIIVWTIFVQNAEELEKYLRQNGIETRLLIGKVDNGTREEIISRFNDSENKDFSVVIANPFTVAESISLHKGCHNALYLERDYNCASFLQSKDRIHRLGLPSNQVTRYFYLVTKDTVDEVIDERLQKKIKRMESLIDTEIPLFFRINKEEEDETDIISGILKQYARRT